MRCRTVEKVRPTFNLLSAVNLYRRALQKFRVVSLSAIVATTKARLLGAANRTMTGRRRSRDPGGLALARRIVALRRDGGAGPEIAAIVVPLLQPGSAERLSQRLGLGTSTATATLQTATVGSDDVDWIEIASDHRPAIDAFSAVCRVALVARRRPGRRLNVTWFPRVASEKRRRYSVPASGDGVWRRASLDAIASARPRATPEVVRPKFPPAQVVAVDAARVGRRFFRRRRTFDVLSDVVAARGADSLAAALAAVGVLSRRRGPRALPAALLPALLSYLV